MKIKILIVLLLFISFSLAAQQEFEPTRMYGGIQAGVPLFWGDIRSLGADTHLGYGAGAFLGFRANRWFAVELGADYGRGKLGASKWQTGDYIDNNGVITYLPGVHKLGDVYAKTNFLRFGLSLPVDAVQLFSPYKNPRFMAEIAPHVYFNNFTPAIYSISDNNKLTDGVKPKDWAYSVGGHVSLGYAVSPKSTLFLRSSVSWLSDEAFEGVSSKPVWRVNVMAHTTLGIRFNFGKKLPARTKVVVAPEPVVAVTPPKTDETAVVEAAKPTDDAAAKEREARETREALVREMQQATIPVIYFQRGNAVLQDEYTEKLEQLATLAKKYDFAPIVIEGWCDIIGPDEVNARLSQQRADAVRDWLIEKGIDPDRFTTRGMGTDKAYGVKQEARRAELRFTAH